MKNSRWLLALVTVAACACSKDEKKDSSLPQGTFAGQTYYVVEAGDLERSDSVLRGSGAIVFASPLNEIESQDNFALEFTVDDRGSLALVTHANNALGQGLTVRFERAGTELVTILSADGAGTTDHVLSGMDASGTLALSVDVHNNETPAHVLIWSDASGSWDEDAALYNSESDADAPGKGKGSLWGLVLRNAELKSVSRRDAKFSE
jgi:hypothetical protein